jgi:hypothetical protein
MVQPIFSGPPLFAGPMLDLVAQVAAVASDIDRVRVSRDLPPLRGAPVGYPAGSIMVGAEWINREQSPPRIILVPTGIRPLPARALGLQPKGVVSTLPTRPFTGRSLNSTRTCGVTRIRRVPTLCTISTQRSSCTGNYWAPVIASSVGPRNWSTSVRAGCSRRMSAGWAVCSRCRLALRVTSRMNPTRSCRTAQRPLQVSRYFSPHRIRGPMAPRQWQGSLLRPHEVN